MRAIRSTAALICCGLLALSAFAQNKLTDEENIDPSKTKTSHSESGDTQTTETKYFDKQGNPVKTEKTTVNPEGSTKETDVYKPDKVVIKTTEKKDNSGKEVETRTETYKNDVLISGTITGPKLWKVFNPETGKYEDWKPVKPFYNVPNVTFPTTPTPTPVKSTEKQPEGGSLKKPVISGELQVPYEYKHKEKTDETGKPIGKRPDSNSTLNQLASRGAIKLDTIGTGETIGHVADVKIDNLTDNAIVCLIPAVVLESRSGKNQDYAVPKSEDVALRPHESKTIPMDGICVNRHKPPVGKGVSGDLIINDPKGNAPSDSHAHLKRGDADKLLRIVKSKYDAVDRLEDDGLLKEIPYKDKKKRKESVEQWSVWADPRISEIEGGQPATKDDLKKVVEKQVEKVSKDEKKKIDKDVDIVWEKIELTSEKAKDLEKPPGGNTFNVDNPPTPAPHTKEKAEKTPQPTPANTSPPPAGTPDDGIPPPKITDKQCARLRNNLDTLLARSNKALKEFNNADLKLYQLMQDAWGANNDINEGYEDQSLILIDQGRDEWKKIGREWGPALRRYNSAYEAVVKTREDLVNQVAAFQRMCPNVPPPEIPELPEKTKYELPDEYGE